MKTFYCLTVLAAVVFTGLSSHAQFVSSSKGSVKQEGKTVHPESKRQHDINLLEQKAKVMERDFLSGNASAFESHKTEVLGIMNREISRSGFDLKELRSKLAALEGGSDSPEGRALRLEIMQMEGRSGKQEYIRTRIREITSEKIKDAKELSGLRAHYYQFIESMKANLKYSKGGSSTSTETPSGTGSSHSASSGKKSNSLVTSGMLTSTQNPQELPESYYRSKDQKTAENYNRTKKNTANSLSRTAKEIQAAMDQNKTQEATRKLLELAERMGSDIAFDKKVTDQLGKGELKFSGLNAGLLKNGISQKTALLNKVKAIQIPGQKSQLFSLISEYISLLQ